MKPEGSYVLARDAWVRVDNGAAFVYKASTRQIYAVSLLAGRLLERARLYPLSVAQLAAEVQAGEGGETRAAKVRSIILELAKRGFLETA